MSSWLESFRDRVVHRSQVGKRRLDATFTRRQLDAKLRELGACCARLVEQGTASIPAELAAAVQEVRALEERLRAEMQDIAALESEG
ncbi:MAG: hypothetical protein HZB56_16405 [Deltaproteobacteria bacterium]|nr:hypothetical protein [Deltaproteobacteria bacterium]